MTDAAAHDAIYSEAYYASDVDAPATAAARIIARSIIEAFNPASVIDVGCGTGALLQALADRHVSVLGLDYSTAALALCKDRGVTAYRFDLADAGSLITPRRYDVCVSLEVAEHLPEVVAYPFVSLLCRLARTVVFTAATPGQGGVDHINEQPHAYWHVPFGLLGFALDDDLSGRWRATWQACGIASWYADNIMVFRCTAR